MKDVKYSLLLELAVPIKKFACNFRESKATQYHHKEKRKFMTAAFTVNCSIT